MTKNNSFSPFFSSRFSELTTHVQLDAELNNSIQALLDYHILISLTDTQGVILYANEKFCAVSGYSQIELIGQTHSIVNSGYHDSEFIDNVWQTLLKQETWRGQFCNRKKNGALYWVDSIITPLLNKHKEPEKYLNISIVREGNLSNKPDKVGIAKAHDKTIKIAEMKLDFLANVSHEIRTPISGILGMLDLLRDTRLTEDQLDIVNTAANSAESVVTVLNNILIFSKLEADYSDKKVLLVEDNIINQKVITAVLGRFRITPEVVENGLDALVLLKKNRYDLILMDCQMSVMDGYETTKNIRLQESNHSIKTPIIALTASNTDEEHKRCLNAGMDDYLSKPFNRYELHEILKTWFEAPKNNSKKSCLNVPEINPDTQENYPQLIWNKSATLQQIDGDEELLQEMIELFLDAVPMLLEDIRNAVQKDDCVAIYESAHSLRSMVNHFCATNLIVKIMTLENAAKENKIANFYTMTEDVINLTNQLIDALSNRK